MLEVLEFATEDARDDLLRVLIAKGLRESDVDVVNAGEAEWWLSCGILAPQFAAVRARLAGSGARSGCRVAHGGCVRMIRRSALLPVLGQEQPAPSESTQTDEAFVEVRGPALVIVRPGARRWMEETDLPGVTSRRALPGAGWEVLDETAAEALARDVAAGSGDSAELKSLADRLEHLSIEAAGIGSAGLGDPVGPFGYPDLTILGVPWDEGPCSDGLLLCWLDHFDLPSFARAIRELEARDVIFHPRLVGFGSTMQAWDVTGELRESNWRYSLDEAIEFAWIDWSEEDPGPRGSDGRWVDIAQVEPDVMVWGLSSDMLSASSLLGALRDVGVVPRRAVWAAEGDLRWAYPRLQGDTRASRLRRRRRHKGAQSWAVISSDSLTALRNAITTALAREFDAFDFEQGLVGSADELALLTLDTCTLEVLRSARTALQRFDASRPFWAGSTAPIRHLLAAPSVAMREKVNRPGLRLSSPLQTTSTWTWVSLFEPAAVEALQAFCEREDAVTVEVVAGVEDLLALDYRDAAALARELRAAGVVSETHASLIATLEEWLDTRWENWRTWQPDATILGFDVSS